MNVNVNRLVLSRQIQSWALVVFITVSVFLCFQTFFQAYRAQGYDLTSYLLSSQALLKGTNPYLCDTPFPYIYPLFFAFMLIPLAVIPYWAANFAWFIISMSALFGSCIVLARLGKNETSTAVGRHLALPGLLIFIIMFSPVQNNMRNGQVNTIVLFSCVMFLYYFNRHKRIISSAWLATAIALKLLPAFLLIFLLLRRQYRLLLWVIAFTIFFCLLPGVITGANLIEYYHGYFNSFLLKRLATENGGPINEMFFSLWKTIVYVLPSTSTNRTLQAASALVSIMAIVAIDLALLRSSRPQRNILSFCAYLIGFLLLSPMAETHHLIFAIPAVFIIGLKSLFDQSWATAPIMSLIAFYIACFAVLSNALKFTPIYFVSLVTLLILLTLAKTRHKESPATDNTVE